MSCSGKVLNLRRGDWEPLEPAGQKYRWPLGLETGVGGGGSLVGLSPRARGIWHSLQVGSVGRGELVGGGKPPRPTWPPTFIHNRGRSQLHGVLYEAEQDWGAWTVVCIALHSSQNFFYTPCSFSSHNHMWGSPFRLLISRTFLWGKEAKLAEVG